MQTELFQKNRPGHIKLGAHAILNAKPASLHFGDHSLPLRNAQADMDFVTGAYGTSVNQAGFLADSHARKDGKQSFRMNLHYPVRGGIPPKGALDRETVRRHGFFHTRRLQKAYREEVREQILGHLRSTAGQAEVNKLASAKLEEILVKHVCLVHFLLRAEPMIDVLVHPAIHEFSGEAKNRWIYVATIREEQAAKAQAQVVALESSVEAHGGRSN